MHVPLQEGRGFLVSVRRVDPGLVVEGMELPELVVREIRSDHILMFALVLRDTNPIHFDTEAVRRVGLGDQIVNQGGVSMAYLLNLLCEWAGSRVAVERIECRFRTNVHAGDEVTAGGVVTGVRDFPRGRVADCDVWLKLPDGRSVITGKASVVLGVVGEDSSSNDHQSPGDVGNGNEQGPSQPGHRSR